MSDDAKLVDIDDLDHYVILGVNKKTGEDVIAVSPGILVPQLAKLNGALQMDLTIRQMMVAMEQYRLDMAKRAQKQSPIIQPGKPS